MEGHSYRWRAAFELGNVVATPAALTAIIFNGMTPTALLRRHANQNWGDLGDEDKAANDAAVTTGGRILSAYTLADMTRIWVITEADRSSTCLLLPEEY